MKAAVSSVVGLLSGSLLSLTWMLLIRSSTTITSAFVISPRSGYPNNNVVVPPVVEVAHDDDGFTTRSSPALFASLSNDDNDEPPSPSSPSQFSLDTALFCAGLAFDAYSEPSDQARWERGPQGLNVAFQSDSYTRSLYNGLLEVQPLRVSDLPDEDSTAEGVLSGGGVDAYLLVAVAEGHVAGDKRLLNKERHHAGVLDLQGSAHAGRSRTAWSNVDEKQARQKRPNDSSSYHVPSTWTRGGTAVWEDDPPFYLYVQDPATSSLVLTVMDEDVVGDDNVIGSTHRALTQLLPDVVDPLGVAKRKIQETLRLGGGAPSPNSLTQLVTQEYRGTLPLDVIPRREDKSGQVAVGVAAGAMVAGPAGAAVGGFLGNAWEGRARGKLEVRVRYLPLPNSDDKTKLNLYRVKGGTPGVDWGELYKRKCNGGDGNESSSLLQEEDEEDFELCVSLTHDKTGCSGAVYRSLKKKSIVVSFRGTCAPVDLITDASIVQTSWVEGVEVPKDDKKDDVDPVPQVHVGFRNSLNSVSRRAKELILAAVAPGESLADYSLLITGHSLGGALATLFAADVAEYGVDAGRGLPQVEPSQPWWGFVNWLGKDDTNANANAAAAQPPRPKDVRLYSFGSPRVGNDVFVEKFESLVKNGSLKEAYRVVNGEDVVTRLPRTVNALGMVKVGYEHCGSTALISLPKMENTSSTAATTDVDQNETPLIWIEGESDNSKCPVRDGTTFVSPLADGSLLGDLVGAVKSAVNENEGSSSSSTSSSGDKNKNQDSDLSISKLGAMASKLGSSVSGRIKNVDAKDLMGVLGIERQYVDREAKIFSSIVSGEAIGHHMEDQYYLAMGRACGFVTLVGEDIKELVPSNNKNNYDDDASLE